MQCLERRLLFLVIHVWAVIWKAHSIFSSFGLDTVQTFCHADSLEFTTSKIKIFEDRNCSTCTSIILTDENEEYHPMLPAYRPGCLRSGLSWFNLWGFLLLRIFSVGISVSPNVCFILDLILISMFLR